MCGFILHFLTIFFSFHYLPCCFPLGENFPRFLTLLLSFGHTKVCGLKKIIQNMVFELKFHHNCQKILQNLPIIRIWMFFHLRFPNFFISFWHIDVDLVQINYSKYDFQSIILHLIQWFFVRKIQKVYWKSVLRIHFIAPSTS